MGGYAPVALFVYNRPEHTKRTLDALSENELAHHTDLFIYSDGPKDLADGSRVEAVREIIRATEGFQSVNIITHIFLNLNS